MRVGGCLVATSCNAVTGGFPLVNPGIPAFGLVTLCFCGLLVSRHLFQSSDLVRLLVRGHHFHPLVGLFGMGVGGHSADY